MASLAAFDSFVALCRPFTFDERPLGQEEGGVSVAVRGSFIAFALITPSSVSGKVGAVMECYLSFAPSCAGMKHPAAAAAASPD